MTDKEYTRFERGERVNQPDLQHVAEESQKLGLAQVIGDVLVGSDGTPSFIEGFASSYDGTVVTVTGGTAITGYRDKGTLYRGAVLSGGPASRSYDVSSLPDGTYGVWIRLSFRPGRTRNRRVWNAIAGEETSRVMQTRMIEDWDLVFEINSPGVEWARSALLVMSGGAIVSLDDYRQRLFDSVSTNRALSNVQWGSTTDRDPANTTGIRSLSKWIWMVMRQLQEIIGGTFFGIDPKSGTADGSDGPRSLTQLNDEKLARNGAQSMTGTLTAPLVVAVNSPKILAKITTNGSGGITFVWGEGVDSVAIDGDSVEVYLDTSVSATDSVVLVNGTLTYGDVFGAVSSPTEITIGHNGSEPFSTTAGTLYVAVYST